MFTEEINDSLSWLFHHGGTSGMETWQSLELIEFGILSWHLGNFYCFPVWRSPDRGQAGGVSWAGGEQ